MEIIKAKEFDPRVGFCITLSDFTDRNLNTLLLLLRDLGLRQNSAEEERSRRLAGVTEPEDENEWITRIIGSTRSKFALTYARSLQLLSGVWKSSELSGQEFLSLLLSNGLSISEPNSREHSQGEH